MRTYYYNEPYRQATWRRGLPTLCIVLLACASFALGRNEQPVATTVATATPLVAPLSPAPTQQPAVLPQAKPKVSALSWNTAVNKADLLLLTNQERSKVGLDALVANGLLDNSAAAKCSNMVKDNYWSHIDLSGQEPWHFIDEAGYRTAAAGENLAYGFSNSAYVVQGWMNSPEHRAALLDTKYRDVGFGICTSANFIGTGPQTIVVQHFGLPLP